MPDRTDRLLRRMKAQPKVPISSEMILPNHSGKHDAGKIERTPTTDFDIANKKYVDDNALSTTLTDANIFVGNASNVATGVAVTGDIAITNAGVTSISSGVIVNADVNASAAIDISKTALVAGTNITLSTNTLNVDDAFLKNDEADTGVGLTLTGDNSSADTQYTAQVLYNTDATPPTASNFPIGTIYIQYTA